MVFNQYLKTHSMNTNNFTIKAQEILQSAQQIAFNAHSPSIETAHLLKALMNDSDGPIAYLPEEGKCQSGLCRDQARREHSEGRQTTGR